MKDRIDEVVSTAIEDMPTFTEGVPTIQFEKVEGFTTFLAEFGFDGDDIIFHFFPPVEMSSDTKSKYWTETFPVALEETALAVFKEGPSRLKAAYVGDYGLNSWWLRAFGFASGLMPKELCLTFFDRLDQRIDSKK